MNQKPDLCRPFYAELPAGILGAHRMLSAAATASIGEYARTTGFSLECLVCAAWSHLLGAFAQAESVDIVTASDNGERLRLTVSPIPASFDGAVQQWLAAVAECLRKRLPLEHRKPGSYPSSRRGQASAIVSAKCMITIGELPDIEPFSRELRNTVFVHVSQKPQLSLSVAASGEAFTTEALDMLVDCLACILQQFPQRSAQPVSHLVLVSDELQAKYPAGPHRLGPVSLDCCAHKAIEEQCRRSPENIAAIFNDEQITYGELDEQSTQLARHLKYLGAGPDMPIAVHFGRSIGLLIAMLGVVRSGAAFVPLDASLPPGRVESVMQASGARIAITSTNLAWKFDPGNVRLISLDEEDAEWRQESTVPFNPYVCLEHLVYVTYTSGSTGTPKGVMIEHGHLAAFFAALDRLLGNEPGVWLAVAGVSFDIAVVELLWTLSRGFKVVLHEGDEGFPLLAGPQSALAQIVRHGVTHLQGTPTLIRMLVQDPAAPSALSQIQKVFLGGETLSADLASELINLVPGEVINGYGPTETTICATAHVVGNVGATVPIGKPLANTAVYVLDNWGRRLPPLAPGELFIGGLSVSRGYLGQPDLTAERFVPDPFQNDRSSRLYRTGDLVHINLDGTLEFLDRLDSQVKIRGYRIELGEIESVLQSHPHVGQSVVVVRDEASSGKSLIAYYISVPGQAPSPAELREYVQKSLPSYMVPPIIVEIDSVPVTPNGKVDRKALAAWELNRRKPLGSSGAGKQSGLAALESALCSWCSEILGLQTVHPSDDFFEIGGHSLAALRLMNRIAEEYGTRLKLSALLHTRSMRALACELRGPIPEKPAWTPVVPLQSQGSDSPVFLIAGLSGNVLNFEPVSRELENRPVYGVETFGVDKQGQVLTSVEEMAGTYLNAVQQVHPEAPYYIAGYSFGGILAFEMAQQLRRAGHGVGLLGLIDTVEWHYSRNVIASMPFSDRLNFLYGDTVKQLLFGPNRSKALIRRLRASLDHYKLSVSCSLGREPKRAASTVEHRNYYALAQYRPQPYDGKIHLFRCPDKSPQRGDDPLLGWGSLAAHVAVVDIPGEHETVLSEPFVHTFGRELCIAIAGTAAAGKDRPNKMTPGDLAHRPPVGRLRSEIESQRELQISRIAHGFRCHLAEL